MCFAIPGKVIEIDKKSSEAIVDYEVEKRKARIVLGDINVGDYVIVSSGFIIRKVPKQEALEAIKIVKNG